MQKKSERFPVFRDRFNELLLTDYGVSVTEFAAFLGLTRQTVGFYLNGDRIPDIATLRLICDKCHVSADWLIGKSSIKSPSVDVQAICSFTGLSEAAVSNLLGECKDPRCLKALDEILKSNYSELHNINQLTNEAITRSFATSGMQKIPAIPGGPEVIRAIKNKGCAVLYPTEAYRYYLSQAAYCFERYIDSIATMKKIASKCVEDETSSKKNMEEENGKYKTD